MLRTNTYICPLISLPIVRYLLVIEVWLNLQTEFICYLYVKRYLRENLLRDIFGKLWNIIFYIIPRTFKLYLERCQKQKRKTVWHLYDKTYWVLLLLFLYKFPAFFFFFGINKDVFNPLMSDGFCLSYLI